MAYTLSVDEEATNAFAYTTHTTSTGALQGLLLEAQAVMLAASALRKYEVAARVREARDAVKAELYALEEDCTESSSQACGEESHLEWSQLATAAAS